MKPSPTHIRMNGIISLADRTGDGQRKGRDMRGQTPRIWGLGVRALAAGGALAALAGCVTPEPVATAPSPAILAPAMPSAVDVVFLTNPDTGIMDGPFDPVTGRRFATEIGSDGELRILIDPKTRQPKLLAEENRAVKETQPAPAPVFITANAPLPTALPDRPVPAPTPAVAAAPKPAAKPAQPAASPRPAVTPVPAAVPVATATPVTGAPGIQLAAFWSKAEAEKGWAALQKAHPELTGHTLTLVENFRQGRSYQRVIASGFASARDAGALCGTLRQRGLVCFTVSL